MNFKKVLITQSQMKNLSGSETVTLELAEYFSSLGSEVTILTHYVDNPMRDIITKVANTRLITTDTQQATQINCFDYDLIWIHHLTLKEKIIEDLYSSAKNKPYVIFHHMSSEEPLEYPTILEAEKELADLILFNSPETIENVSNKSGFTIPENKIMNFGNPAPDYFYEKRRTYSPSNDLKSVLVVSNHPPREVEDAGVFLRRRGFKVDYIGRSREGSEERVTPKLLDSYDLVITIGKTTQYAIVNNLPVYCYDRFGGPGFLSKENYELSMNRNFSGRGFTKKSALDIVNEIVNGYSTAAKQMYAIHLKYAEEFLLSIKIDEVKKRLDLASSDLDKKLKIENKNSLIAYTSNINRFMPAYLLYNHELKHLKSDLELTKDALEKSTERVVSLESFINEITSRKAIVYANFTKRQMQKIKKSVKNPLIIKNKVTNQLQKINKNKNEKIRTELINSEKYADFIYPTFAEKIAEMSYEDIQARLTEFNNIHIDWKTLAKKPKNDLESQKKVTIVVLVLNNLEMTTRCIDSLYAVNNDINFNVVVVDNGSEAETLSGMYELQKKYGFKFVCVDQNVNFSLGNNIGFTFVDTEFTIFINNDTYVTDGWVDEMVNLLESDDNAKAVQPTLLYPEGDVQCMGIVFSSKSYIGYPLYSGMPKVVVKEDRKFQAVTAACIGVRSKEFASIKGFDPNFVNGQEDIDLCLRLTENSPRYYCLTSDNAVVYHDEGRTPGRGRRVIENRKTFLNRWRGKIRADDQNYYDEDGFVILDWKLDSERCLEEGVELYTPVLEKKNES